MCQIPPNAGGTTTVRSDHVYDLDGNVLHICTPREFSPTEGNSSTCTATGAYSTHNAWDNSGRLSTVTTYRTVGGTANVGTYTYDADGNPLTYQDPNPHITSYSYDLLDRKIGETKSGQAGAYTIISTYDPNGNQTSVTRATILPLAPLSELIFNSTAVEEEAW